MIYTADEKRALDSILEAFSDYIQGHDYFDIVYSEKIGYVKIQAYHPFSVESEVMNTPEALLTALFDEMVNDVVFSSDNSQQGHEDSNLTEYEETEGRRRITAILETMEDGDKVRYLDFLDTYIKEYQENNARLGCHDGE